MTKRSLTAQAENPGTALATPVTSGLTQPMQVAPPSSANSTPYISFAASIAAESWQKLSRSHPGITENAPVLIPPEPDPTLLLNPFRAFWLHGFQFWCTQTPDWNVDKATLTENRDWVEMVEACMLVCTPGGLIPARSTFKKGNAHGAKKAAQARRDCELPEWVGRGADFKATLTLPPERRFLAHFQPSIKTSKSSGRRYFFCDANIVAPTAADLQSLFAFDRDPTSPAKLKAVEEAYLSRFNYVRSKIA